MRIFGLFSIECNIKFYRLPTKRQITEQLEKGEYIKAIKLHRHKTGKGLKDSKDYIDRLCKKRGFCYSQSSSRW